jgi:hypothetical protein
MKTLISILLTITITPFCNAQEGNSKELVSDGLKRLTVQFGMVNYEVSGDASGEVTYTFNDWGWKESTVRTLTYTLYGMKSNLNKMEVRDGDVIMNIDISTKEGSKTTDTNESELLRYKSPEETQKAILESRGGKINGMETILDKETNIWVFESGNIQSLNEWNGIVLKAVVKLPAKLSYTYTATSIDLETEPEIAVPEDISWTK